jgi:hypothetical protein
MENTENTFTKSKNKGNTSRYIAIIIVGLLVAGIVWYAQNPVFNSSFRNGEQVVTDLTHQIGEDMQKISLLGPKDTVESDIERYYKPIVTPELYAIWKTDINLVPGRVTSSPYPQKIDITRTEKMSKTKYRIFGTVVEVANGAGDTTEVAGTYPITITYSYLNGKWLISELEKGPYAAEEQD